MREHSPDAASGSPSWTALLAKIQSQRSRAFGATFEHHVARQDHHAEYFWPKFIYRATTPQLAEMEGLCREMPAVAAVEMVVDGLAAYLSYEAGRQWIPRLPENGEWAWQQR